MWRTENSPNRLSPEEDEAIKIQRWWRKYLDVNVYRYYRDLINFRLKGEPGLMLRAINPNEARYLDAASGIHVKFRLAGEHFPPQIYYKIFTHRPVQDIGAYAPRDYTGQGAKIPLPRIKHNRTRATNMEDAGRGGWYKRYENNGWRLVSDRVVHRLLQTSADPVTMDTSGKKTEFHHSMLQRKQDAYERRKQRRIDWMRKIYTFEMDDEKFGKLIFKDGKAPPGDGPSPGKDDLELEDSEVNELIRWSDSLDFDDYWINWKEIATTSCSDFSVQERLRLKRFEPLSVSTYEGSLPLSTEDYTEGTDLPSSEHPAVLQ